jgi:PPOX class probable F420-dependent enzyme
MTARTPARQRPGRDLLVDIVVPVGLFYGLRALGLGVYPTLVVAAAVPAAVVAVRLVRYRQVDGLGVFMLSTMALGALVSALSGSPRALLAREGYLTGVAGLWFLVSAGAGRPLAFLYSRPLLERRTRTLGVAADWDELWERLPAFRRIWRVSTVLWGAALLVDSAVRVWMAYALPVDEVPGLGTVLYCVTSAVLIAVTNGYYFAAGLYQGSSALYAPLATAPAKVTDPGPDRPDIWDAGGPPGGLAAEEYVALTTYRRDETPVTTPVWAASDGGRLYVYTPSRSGKVGRIRADPEVLLAACSFDGTPHGPAVTARARVLPAPEMRRARRALTAKYGNRFRWFRVVLLLGRARRAGGGSVGLEIGRP